MQPFTESSPPSDNRSRSAGDPATSSSAPAKADDSAGHRRPLRPFSMVPLPRGRWIDFWTGEAHEGGGEVVAEAPLGRIPVYVREGALVVSYPAGHVAGGLGDTPETERPLEATLWGEPACGRAGATLADGTRVRWREGRWSVSPDRPLRTTSR